MICQDRRMEMNKDYNTEASELDKAFVKDYIEKDMEITGGLMIMQEELKAEQKREMKAKYKKIAMVAGATVIAAGGLYLLDRMRKSDTFAYDPVEDAIKDVTPVDGEFDE